MLELLASDARSLVQDALTYSILVAALIWGAGPERAVIATWVVFFELAKMPHDLIWARSVQLQSVDGLWAATDLGASVSWVMIALYANRNYTLFIAGLQLLAVAAHVTRGWLEIISPFAYVTMFTAPGWLQLFLMAAGLFRHAQRERRYGPYREWRVALPWLDWLSVRIRRS